MEARLRKKLKKEAQKLLKSLHDSSSESIPEECGNQNIVSDVQEIKSSHHDIQANIQEIHSENQEIQSHIQEIQSKAQEIQYQISKINLEIERNRSGDKADDYLLKLAKIHSILEDSSASQNGRPKCENQNSIDHDDDIKDEECADPIAMKEMLSNLNSILEKGHFTDVSIKCGDDILKAHKIVLSARSPVFEAMFTSPMRESDLDVVVIDDIDSLVFQDLLTFMYSGQVKDLSLSKAGDLLYAAEKYQINPLKQVCVNFLRSSLSEESALQILHFADLYDSQLKMDSMDFICDHFSVLEIQDEWKSVQSNNPKMALEIYSTVVKKLQKKN